MDLTVVDRALGSDIPYVTYAIPAFFGLMAVELAAGLAVGRRDYRLNDTLSDLGCGITDQTIGIFLKSAVFAGYLWCYGFVTARGLNVVDVTSYSPAGKWVAAAGLFLGVDLAYYWFHRIAHEYNAPWATHVVHHSSEEYNLAVALRQGAFQSLCSWVFYLPLALLGFPPLWFLAMSAFNTLYQFWIHTRVIGRLGPLEWVINTPSHHRVHHARNPKYLDRNYAGVLIIWDRLFGTFQAEDEEPVYGLTKPLNSWNPIWATMHVWVDLWRDARRAASWTDALKVWVAPQGWRPRGLAPTPPPPQVSPATAVQYDTRADGFTTAGAALQFLLTLVAAVSMLALAGPGTPRPTLAAGAILILWSLGNVAGMIEKRSWVRASETAWLVAAAAGAVWVLTAV